MPTFHVEVLSPGNSSLSNGKHSSLPDYCCTQKPSPGELRRVHIDKSVEPLGIQIQCLDSGGVFVSTVTERSLASQVILTLLILFKHMVLNFINYLCEIDVSHAFLQVCHI